MSYSFLKQLQTSTHTTRFFYVASMLPRALAQLNASFPSPTGGSVKSPASVTSADVRSVTTAFTTATTVRSTAGLMAAQDGKKGRVAKNSSNNTGVDDDDMSYIR